VALRSRRTGRKETIPSVRCVARHFNHLTPLETLFRSFLTLETGTGAEGTNALRRWLARLRWPALCVVAFGLCGQASPRHVAGVSLRRGDGRCYLCRERLGLPVFRRASATLSDGRQTGVSTQRLFYRQHTLTLWRYSAIISQNSADGRRLGASQFAKHHRACVTGLLAAALFSLGRRSAVLGHLRVNGDAAARRCWRGRAASGVMRWWQMPE